MARNLNATDQARVDHVTQVFLAFCDKQHALTESGAGARIAAALCTLAFFGPRPSPVKKP